MEYTKLPNVKGNVSRIGLGAWSIGGALWGGTNDDDAIATILKAFNKGINLIDTAPGYGNGHSETLIGKALKRYGNRDNIIIATKFGLNLEDPNNVFRDSRRDFIFKEINNSLRRLQVDYIDLYQVHWPDPTTPLAEAAETLNELLHEGKIRAVGVSNFSIEQMKEFQKYVPLHTDQSPCNLFEREIEKDILPYCLEEGIGIIGYSSLCRGMLSGKMKKDREFKGDDLRKGMDPKFQQPVFSQYVDCADALKKWVWEKYRRPLAALAVRWVLDKKVNVALWGARKPEQLDEIDAVFDWKLTQADFSEIDSIIKHDIKNPVGPQFMAPPVRSPKKTTSKS